MHHANQKTKRLKKKTILNFQNLKLRKDSQCLSSLKMSTMRVRLHLVTTALYSLVTAKEKMYTHLLIQTRMEWLKKNIPLRAVSIHRTEWHFTMVHYI